MNETPSPRQNRLIVTLCLLLALALIGGGIGFWVYRSIRQLRAVEAVRAFDAFAPTVTGASATLPASSVAYGYELDENFQAVAGAPPGPAWVRNQLGIDFVATVRAAGVYCASPDAVRLLTTLSRLRSLELGADDRIIGQILPQLKDLPDLERLVLSNLPITDNDLAFLPTFPRLRILKIEACPLLTDGSLDQISRMAGLESLSLTMCDGLGAAGLAHLERAPRLEKLEISWVTWLDDAPLAEIARLTKLRELLVMGMFSSSTDDGLASIGRMTNLRGLTLTKGDPMTDAGLAQLAGLKHLERLTLYGQYSPEAVGALQRRLPDCRIEAR